MTVLEPYREQPMVRQATAGSADEITIELADGRVQQVRFHGFAKAGGDLSVEIRESMDGQVKRRETLTGISR